MIEKSDFSIIRNILLSEWDPLEIGGNSNLADEYDAYIPELARVLATGGGSDAVADYLKAIENEMDIDMLPERRLGVARRLIDANLR